MKRRSVQINGGAESEGESRTNPFLIRLSKSEKSYRTFSAQEAFAAAYLATIPLDASGTALVCESDSGIHRLSLCHFLRLIFFATGTTPDVPPAHDEFPVPSVIRRRTYINVRRRREQSGMKRLRIYMRDKFRCQYCGEKKGVAELTLDHILPRSRGGDNSPVNIVRLYQVQQPEEQPYAGRSTHTAANFADSIVSTAAAQNIAQRTEGFSFAYLKELFLSSMMQWMADSRTQSFEAVVLEQRTRLQSQMRATEQMAREQASAASA